MPAPPLYTCARRYLGVPFLHQGRDPTVGIDCIGLGQLACRDHGLVVPDWTDYGRHPHRGLLESRLEQLFGPSLPIEQMQPSDIAVVYYGGGLRHAGIVGVHDYDGVAHLTLIHTDSRVGRAHRNDVGCVVEHRIDEGWLGRKRPAIGCVYRPGVVP